MFIYIYLFFYWLIIFLVAVYFLEFRSFGIGFCRWFLFRCFIWIRRKLWLMIGELFVYIFSLLLWSFIKEK